MGHTYKLPNYIVKERPVIGVLVDPGVDSLKNVPKSSSLSYSDP